MNTRLTAAYAVMPGLTLTVVVAWLGLSASGWIGTGLLGFEKSPVSGIMLAIVFGMVGGNAVRLPALVKPGIRFSLARVLRLGIILLGIGLGLGEAVQVGLVGVPLIVLCIGAAMLVTYWLGRRLALSGRMGVLIAVGTSICGATAIVATAPAIGADEDETAYAVANITVFGLLAMFAYPYLADFLFAGDLTSTGRFLGTSIHETAQVAGSGLIYVQVFGGDTALDVAAVTKLVRNCFIILVIPLMAYVHQRQSRRGGEAGVQVNLRALFPMFIIGFALMAVVRTVGDVTLENGLAYGVFDASGWGEMTGGIQAWAERLLAVAMAGVGLGTSVRQLRGLGVRPFYVGLGAAAVVGGVSVLGITAMNLLGVG